MEPLRVHHVQAAALAQQEQAQAGAAALLSSPEGVHLLRHAATTGQEAEQVQREPPALLPGSKGPTCPAALSLAAKGAHPVAAAALAKGRVASWRLDGAAEAQKPSAVARLPADACALLPVPFAAGAHACFVAVLPGGALWSVAGQTAAEAVPAPQGGGGEVLFAASEAKPNFSVVVVVRRAADALTADLYRLRAAARAAGAAAGPAVTLLGSHALAARRAPLAAAAFDLGCRTLALLFGDGELQAYRFSESATRANALAAAPELTVRRSLALAAGEPPALAFVAPSVLGVVSGEGAVAEVAFWDTVYGTVLGRQEVRVPAGKKPAKPAAAWAAPASGAGRFVADAGAGVALVVSRGTAVPVSVSVPAAPTLAAALGRMAETLPHVAAAQQEELSGPRLLAAAGTPPGADEDVGPGEERERKLLADLEAAKTAATFRKRFVAYAEAVRVEEPPRPASRRRKRAEAEAAAEEQQNAEEQQRKRARRVFSQPLMARTARRCLEGKGGEKDLTEPLELLLRSNKFSGRYVPELVPRLVERRWLGLLRLCLVHVHDLPETDIVRVVQFALAETAGADGDEEDAAGKVDPDDHAAESFLHLALSCPRSDVLLQAALGNLSASEVLQLLRYLHKWLARYWDRSEHDLRRAAAGQRVPTLSQVLDWTSMLLDQHLTALLQMPEAHQWVREAQYLVTAQHVALCERMEGLKGVLRHLKTRKGLPRRAPTDYSVEMLWPLGQPRAT